MKKILLLIVFTLQSLLIAQSLNKTYILSEGGFGEGLSKLSQLESSTNTFTQSIFSPGNIGLYPDGLLLDNNLLFLVEQGSFGGSGKVYILDTNGVKLKEAIVGTNPYSIAKSNNKLYITNGPASNVSVLSANDLSLIKTIDVGAYPQEIIANDKHVFVANTSIWNGTQDSTVSVIDSKLDSVINTIVVKKDPSSLVIDNNSNLLIGCPGDENSGFIYIINTTNFSKIDSFTIPTYGFGSQLNIDSESDNLYMIANTNDIVEYESKSKTAKVIVPADFTSKFYYGYSYEPKSKQHFVADAKNFTVEGELATYDSLGNSVNTYTTGIAPKRIVFSYSGTSTGISDDLTISNFSLTQNYPNPFNPSTKINYSISTNGNKFVKLSVYNSLGQEVAVLVNGIQSGGNHQVNFNAKNLSSGIYYYTLRAGNNSLTKKMMLIK